MKSVKTAILVAFILCIGVVVSTAVTAHRIESSVLRLHIRANGNSAEEQETKLYVRDCILEEAGTLFAFCETKEESLVAVEENLELLKQIADEALARRGAEYTANVYLDEQWFPTRVYDGLALPAGTYSALVIELGSGGGENWWCMLYPALCPFGQSVKQTENSKAKMQVLVGDRTYRLLTQEKTAVRFKLVEIWDTLTDKLRY